jgi:hypothetical protein
MVGHDWLEEEEVMREVTPVLRRSIGSGIEPHKIACTLLVCAAKLVGGGKPLFDKWIHSILEVIENETEGQGDLGSQASGRDATEAHRPSDSPTGQVSGDEWWERSQLPFGSTPDRETPRHIGEDANGEPITCYMVAMIGYCTDGKARFVAIPKEKADALTEAIGSAGELQLYETPVDVPLPGENP